MDRPPCKDVFQLVAVQYPFNTMSNEIDCLATRYISLRSVTKATDLA